MSVISAIGPLPIAVAGLIGGTYATKAILNSTHASEGTRKATTIGGVGAVVAGIGALMAFRFRGGASEAAVAGAALLSTAGLGAMIGAS